MRVEHTVPHTVEPTPYNVVGLAQPVNMKVELGVRMVLQDVRGTCDCFAPKQIGGQLLVWSSVKANPLNKKAKVVNVWITC